MPIVKKLSSILKDTLSIIAQSERTHHDVLIRYLCYRNGLLVHTSTPMQETQFADRFPQTCKFEKATNVTLIVTGFTHKQREEELYNASFQLASRKEVATGLSGTSIQPVQTLALQPSGNGLGAAEVVALSRKLVAEELLQRDYERVKEEAYELRKKVSGLESDLAEREARIQASNNIKDTVAMLAPFAPAAVALFGGNTAIGKAINGLGGVPDEATQPQDDEQTAMVIGLVREFLVKLNGTHRQQMVSLMVSISQDHSLITRIAQFVRTSPPPKKPTPEQKPVENGKPSENM